MNEYLIVDAHIHTYPRPEIGIQAMGGEKRAEHAGTIEELLSFMKETGISYAVMMNFTPLKDMRDAAYTKIPSDLPEEKRKAAESEIEATMLGRLERRNRWTCDVGKEHPELVPFIGLDNNVQPESMVKEMEDKITNHGAKGLKIHFASQRFFANDRILWPAYAKAEELGTPIMFHGGRFFDMEDPVYARPKLFHDLLSDFPRLNAVMAHLGGIEFIDEALELAEKYPNLNFDCCGIIAPGRGFSDDEAVGTIRTFGVERVMFGSDWPFVDPRSSIERIKTLGFTEEEKKKILGENAIRIYQIRQ